MIKLSDFIVYLRDTTIPKANKVDLISKVCKEQPWIKEVLKYTYDPFIQYFIKSKFPIATKVYNSNSIIYLDEVFWIKFIKPLLIRLNKREFDTKTYTTILIDLLNVLPDIERDILHCIITKDLKIGFASRSINNALNEELIPVSDCQLCKSYSTDMTIKNVDYWYASRKLNGLRGRYKEREDSFVFLTREDYPLVGFDFITEELERIRKEYDLTLIDGEVFSKKLPFQTIMSIARNEKNIDPELKKELKFYIFNIQKKITWKDTSSMITELNNIFINNQTYQYICPLQYEKIDNDSDSILSKCIQYTNEGFEGVVIRHPIVSFDPGKRNNNLLKFKLFNESDLKVTEILWGEKGKKWEHSVTALKCTGTIRAKKLNHLGVYIPVPSDENIEGIQYVNIPVIVEATCSSCTDKEREELTLKCKNNPEDIIDRIIEVKYQTFTDKPNEDGYYSLQFPVFQKFKDL